MLFEHDDAYERFGNAINTLKGVFRDWKTGTVTYIERRKLAFETSSVSGRPSERGGKFAKT